MNRPPAVSVIIHFLNAERYLNQSVRSVFWQTFTDWELLLVDGGSTDQSEALARQWEREHPGKIRVLRHSGPATLGIFSSRIWGVEEARAPLVALLDSDDEWHPQLLERHEAIYRHHFSQRPGLVYGPNVYWWEDIGQADKSHVQPVPPPGLHEAPSLVITMLEDGYARSACNTGVFAGREVLLSAKPLIGSIDEKSTEDQYLWSHVMLHYPVYVSPEPLARYRQWGNSTTAVLASVFSGVQRRHLMWLLGYLDTHADSQYRTALKKEVERRLAPPTRKIKWEHRIRQALGMGRQAVLTLIGSSK